MSWLNLQEIDELKNVTIIEEWSYKYDYDFFWERTGDLMILKLNKDPEDIECLSGYLLVFSKNGDTTNFSSWEMSRIENITIDGNSLILEATAPYEEIIISKLIDVEDVYNKINKYVKLSNKAIKSREEEHQRIKQENGGKDEEYYIVPKDTGKKYVTCYDCWRKDNILYMLEDNMSVLYKEELKKIKIEDILYYRVYNQKDTIAEINGGDGWISGGGSNLGGAILGGIVAGTPGAIIGSREQVKGKINAVKTSTRTINNSFIILKTKTKTIELVYTSIEALEALIPEKDYDRIISSKEKVQETNTQDDVVTEIRKYKALLDEGIITEEEFEKLKKKILGI